MDLKERTYRTLLVSSAEKMTSPVKKLLVRLGCQPVTEADHISLAKRLLRDRSFDLILINSPLPDDTGIRFAIDAAGSGRCAVLLITSMELYEEITEKVVPFGVFTLPRPVHQQSLIRGLSWMKSARELLRTQEKKTLSVEDKVEEIRLVNRAKWLLISQAGLSEAEAHRVIEKRAMDHSISRRKVAEDIITTYT